VEHHQKWAWDQIHAGKVKMPFAEVPGDLFLTAKTQEFRRFAEEHAAEKHAFSKSYRFIRVN